MLGYEEEQRSLTKEQKKAIGLLSIGTFLEYVDFMLYIHMGAFLNEIFFAPTNNPYSAALLGAFFLFCPFYCASHRGPYFWLDRRPYRT